MPKIIVLSAICFLVSSCAASELRHESESIVRTVGNIDIYSEDGERGLIFIFPTSSSLEKYCYAPPPDAIQEGGGGLSLSLPSVAGQSSASGSSSTQIEGLSLGGRNPAILITREIMYRTCEFSNNFGLAKDEAKEFYLKNLDFLKAVLPSQVESASSALDGNVTPVSSNTTDSSDTADDGDSE